SFRQHMGGDDFPRARIANSSRYVYFTAIIATVLLLTNVGCQLFEPVEPLATTNSPPAPVDRLSDVRQVQHLQPIDEAPNADSLMPKQEHITTPPPEGLAPPGHLV